MRPSAWTAQKKFKLHPDCYALVEKLLGVKREDVMFVSSNGFDVVGAKHFGFEVAWIRRGGAAGLPAGLVLPAQMYRLLWGSAESVGYREDYTVSALTELPSLLELDAPGSTAAAAQRGK